MLCNRGAGIESEDFEKCERDSRGHRDDRAANDRQFARVHVAAPDGKSTGDNRRDAEHEAKQHNHGETVADAGLELGRAEANASGGESIDGVELQLADQPRNFTMKLSE